MQASISLLTRTLPLAPEVGTDQHGQLHADLAEWFKFLCHGIGVTDTLAITCRKSEQTLRRHEDRLQIAGPLGGGGVVRRQCWNPPHASIPPP
jgi:hypothetical protein